MRYITGVHALNLPCSLDTLGDWHRSGINWGNVRFAESNDSIFGDYGIEKCNSVPENPGEYYIANTLRALLDILESGYIEPAQDAEVFISNTAYEEEFFEHVWMLRGVPHWPKIDKLMGKEFLMNWVKFKEEYCG